MKKTILIFAAVLAFASAAAAQPRAIGARATAGFEASYQHTVGARENFFEVDLGYSHKDWFNAVAIFDFMIAQPDWTSRGEWGFYAGPGLAIGGGTNKFAFGVAGNVGLEYTFWFPLQLSIDFRPQIGYVDHSFNWWGWYPALGVRYRF